MPKREVVCERCEHYNLTREDGHHCRRYPRSWVTWHTPGGPESGWRYPETDPKLNCGEFTEDKDK